VSQTQLVCRPPQEIQNITATEQQIERERRPLPYIGIHRSVLGVGSRYTHLELEQTWQVAFLVDVFVEKHLYSWES